MYGGYLCGNHHARGKMHYECFVVGTDETTKARRLMAQYVCMRSAHVDNDYVATSHPTLMLSPEDRWDLTTTTELILKGTTQLSHGYGTCAEA